MPHSRQQPEIKCAEDEDHTKRDHCRARRPAEEGRREKQAHAGEPNPDSGRVDRAIGKSPERRNSMTAPIIFCSPWA